VSSPGERSEPGRVFTWPYAAGEADTVRLGITASEMEGSKTGVGRFLEGLFGGLVECDFDGEMLLFFHGEAFDHPLWGDPRFEPVFAGETGGSVTLWEQMRLPAALPDLDLFFGPAYSLPRRLPCPGVVMLHDLSFEVLPEEFRFRERWRRRHLARRSARQARRVLAGCEAVASDIASRYRVARERIGLLRYGVDSDVFRSDAEPARSDVEAPYLLFLGAVMPRRRLDVLLDAFSALAAEDPALSLVLAGTNRLPVPGDLQRWIDERGLGDRIQQLGWVPEEDLPGLIAGAELSFYLSTYEGYGLPPLESLACSTLPVVSSGLALDDLWPDYPYRCTRLEAGEIVEVSRRALAGEQRGEVVRRGRELVETLTWKACAENFLAQAREALRG
jgi:alpha-1,3-rhamnosyl/mannosyltransferase